MNQAIIGPTLSSWFTSEYKKSGKKLDMGKGCVRFKSLEDLALDVVGRTVDARVRRGVRAHGQLPRDLVPYPDFRVSAFLLSPIRRWFR